MKAALFGLMASALVATEVEAKNYNYFALDLGATQHRDLGKLGDAYTEAGDDFSAAYRLAVGGRFSNTNPYMWFELVAGSQGRRSFDFEDGASAFYERRYYGAGLKATTNPNSQLSAFVRGGLAATVINFGNNAVGLPETTDSDNDTLYYAGAGASLRIGSDMTMGFAADMTDLLDNENKKDWVYSINTSFYF